MTKKKAKKPKEQPVCPDCGSDKVSADGPHKWDIEKQDWVACGGVYDGGYCEYCMENIRHFDWKEVQP